MTFEIAIPDWEMKTYIQIISVLYAIVCYNFVYADQDKYLEFVNERMEIYPDDLVAIIFAPVLYFLFYFFKIFTGVLVRTILLPGFIYRKFKKEN